MDLRELLLSARTIAVVGLSAEPDRPSFEVAQYLQSQGYRIRPVNPKYAGQTILGELCVAKLTDIDEPVDIVDVFRKTEDVLPVAQAALAIRARCLWQQRGIANLEADRLAREAGLLSVYDRCLMMEHRRFVG